MQIFGLVHPPASPARRGALPSRLLARLAHPPGPNRRRSVLIIVAMAAFLGWLDHLTGRASLALFYLVPISLAVAWVGWPFACVVAGAALAIRIASDLTVGPYPFPATATWNRVMDLMVYFAVIWMVHAFIMLHRDLEERVRQRTAALERALADRAQLQHQLFEAGRRERAAVGHDLHDGLGQHLTATAMAATLLESRLASTQHPATENARQIISLLQEAIAMTRQVARGLLLSSVEPGELAAELEELASTLHEEFRVPCQFTLKGAVHGIDTATSSHLFYIAQEAARNSLRHARPTQVNIELNVEERALTLSVRDNGSRPARPGSQGIGVRIMQHRSELIGGEFSMERIPTRGTRVRCHLHLSAEKTAVST